VTETPGRAFQLVMVEDPSRGWAIVCVVILFVLSIAMFAGYHAFADAVQPGSCGGP
jgi:hypothetical protein